MISVLGKNVYISTNIFYNNQTVVNVDLCNLPFVNNSMSSTFRECGNLVSVTNINNNVTDMYCTFILCPKFNSISTIPDSVTNMEATFHSCTNLTKAPRLPNNVTTLVSTFQNCYNLVNVPNIPNNVTNMRSMFRYCSNLTNLPNISGLNLVTDMVYTFGGCTNLNTTPTIPNNVVWMSGTFMDCSKLVNAPIIPNSVTDMLWCFSGCTNLVNAPIIPNSVKNMHGTFRYCYNLNTAPTIPNGVTNMCDTFINCNKITTAPQLPSSVTNISQAFLGCSNLTGNIYIHSENITNAYQCFAGTYLNKNVYIPFKYENSVDTQTYNAFIAAGYNVSGSGTANVYLKEIPTLISFNVTPSDADIMYIASSNGAQVSLDDWTYTNVENDYELQTYTGNDTDITLPNIYTELTSNPLEVNKNDTISYVIVKNGYYSSFGTVMTNSSKTIDVDLNEMQSQNTATLSIASLPPGATITLSASGYTQKGNSITVPKGTSVTYTVSKQHFVTKSETVVVNSTVELVIGLDYKYSTLTINSNVQDSDIEIFVNGKLANANNSDWKFTAYDDENNIEIQEYIGSGVDIIIPSTYNIINYVTVGYDDVIEYSVKKEGYNKVTGTVTNIDEDTVINVTLTS